MGFSSATEVSSKWFFISSCCSSTLPLLFPSIFPFVFPVKMLCSECRASFLIWLWLRRIPVAGGGRWWILCRPTGVKCCTSIDVLCFLVWLFSYRLNHDIVFLLSLIDVYGENLFNQLFVYLFRSWFRLCVLVLLQHYSRLRLFVGCSLFVMISEGRWSPSSLAFIESRERVEWSWLNIAFRFASSLASPCSSSSVQRSCTVGGRLFSSLLSSLYCSGWLLFTCSLSSGNVAKASWQYWQVGGPLQYLLKCCFSPTSVLKDFTLHLGQGKLCGGTTVCDSREPKSNVNFGRR